ncbi:PREDICTED: uncharacterized protein CXorf49 homolog [Chrysochloris asiatica]|uniref:Uncharacterized protein CXorf49 homolog n=1 Tax=Chrysochloris asiatica TaxID=185453 RepID=A0A9B0WVK9_CHRAS|nr:PREDICTED: uncharacterized protein CXorf49 homolog [Chrysochloris asiatica]
MSSPDEVPFGGASHSPEKGEKGSLRGATTGSPRGRRRGLDVGTPHSGESRAGLPVAVGFKVEREVIGDRGAVRRSRQGRPASPTGKKENALEYILHFEETEESLATARPMTKRDTRRVRRNSSPESCATQRPCMEEDLAGVPSDSESSDEFSEIPLMKVIIQPKAKVQAKSDCPEDPGDAPRASNPHAKDNVVHVPDSFLSATARRFPSAAERQQPVGELEMSSRKKMQSVAWGKKGARPDYPRAASASTTTAAVAAASVYDLPRATLRKKEAQEKKCLSGASKVALERKHPSLPSWGQRVPMSLPEPATFPPISGISLLGRSKRESSVPSGPRQPRHNAGKKSLVSRTRELELVTQDDDPNRDPTSMDLSLYCGEGSSGEPSPRAPQVPGSSQPLALDQEVVRPRNPTPSGDQRPLTSRMRQNRQQQPPRVQGCPRCVMLQKEIDELKEQLAALQSLTDKFLSLISLLFAAHREDYDGN